MVASYAGHIDCVRELVLQGADINLQREVGQGLPWNKNDAPASVAQWSAHSQSAKSFGNTVCWGWLRECSE